MDIVRCYAEFGVKNVSHGAKLVNCGLNYPHSPVKILGHRGLRRHQQQLRSRLDSPGLGEGVGDLKEKLVLGTVATVRKSQGRGGEDRIEKT